ncbi:MAG: alanine racemase [Candidatus Eisenbacteria bacterium]
MNSVQGASNAKVSSFPVWVEIDAAAYRHNLRALARVLRPGTRRMAVVKANAYGHGARLITPLALTEGVDYLGVHSLGEFEELAGLAGATPVCLLGPTLPRNAAATVASGVEPTVSELEIAEALAAQARAQARPIHVHIKVETGTHRQGILFDEIPAWAEFLHRHPELHLRGLHTHYANIEDTTDHTIARRQLARLEEARQCFVDLGHPPEMVHSACSAAAIVMEATHGDLARLGIASYGLWPSRETYLSTLLSLRMGPELMPVLSWKTRISQIKQVPVGEFIGYGCSVRTTHRMRLAVLPVGYYDGYPRGLSGHGYVLVHGKRAPIAGRVCMNMTMVDITDLPEARIEDEVILIGRSGGDAVSADTLAALCGTINYEVVARIGGHVPRVCRGVPE